MGRSDVSMEVGQKMGPLKPDTDGLGGFIFKRLRFLIQIFNRFMVP